LSDVVVVLDGVMEESWVVNLIHSGLWVHPTAKVVKTKRSVFSTMAFGKMAMKINISM
jgi:hypothetical protein